MAIERIWLGTGKTSIAPGLTLVVGENGELTAYTPTGIAFKDGYLFRPLCPFLRIHARWSEADGKHEGPVTEALLPNQRLSLGDVHCEVSVANLKPFKYDKRSRYPHRGVRGYAWRRFRRQAIERSGSSGGAKSAGSGGKIDSIG
jgi:hypothetical protein